jgi:cytochrome oxidase Cu insertion factor (SCO1/SenC/PrrC family)
MSFEDKLFAEIDDLTNEIMDEIRVVLSKYEVHFPEWNDDDVPTNLDDNIYGCIHSEIRYALDKQKGTNEI